MAILIVMALSWLSAPAMPTARQNPEAMADSLTVSFITCYPGPEIYELYGHEGVRVRGMGRDSIWNYGVFDFREPNFVYRFVKGETDYMGVGYPFEWFLPEYRARGSKVVEQDLNLTQDEARRFLETLQVNSLPENRKYRYNYVRNNCATRIFQTLDSAASSRVIYPDSLLYGTFRNEMRHYNRNYPWYQLGIDVALGSGLDHRLRPRDEMFVPMEMMRMTAGARLADGRQLVREERVLYEGRGDVTLPPTLWWQGPLFWSWVVFAVSALVGLYCFKRKRIVKWIYTLWFTLLGVAGAVVAFLVFVSSHEATSPNMLLAWLNPLQLIFAVCLWWRTVRPGAYVMAYYNVVAMTCLLCAWPFQHQSTNPALFPLMGATLLLAAVYAIIAPKESYNNNGLPSTKTTPKRGKSTPRQTKSRKAKAE